MRIRSLVEVAAAGAVSVVPVLAAGPASAATAAGTVEVVRPASGGGGRLGSGGSATTFSLKLPSGAACAKDSFDGDMRVQSYMVPVADDPAQLSFGSQGPTGPGRHPFYDIYTSAYANAVTAKSEPPGGPGPIVSVPTLSFKVYAPGELLPGVYKVGVACTSYGKVDRYWSTQMTLTTNAADKPAGVVWKVDGLGSGSSSTGVIAMAAVGGVGLTAAAGIVVRRRRRS